MRGKTSSCAVASLALLLALPSSGFAQGKIRVAVWEFENHAGSQHWYSNQLGPAARNQIDTEFSENQLLSAKFSVVERDKLNLVLKEQGLATAGAVDPTTAAKVGKLRSGDYLSRIASAAAPAGGLQGKVIKVEGTKAWINLGALSGIKVGDRFMVFTVGEALIDPDTGAKLGADQKQTGDGAVVEVQSKYAVINFTGAAK